MRISLRSLFAVTTYIALVIAAIVVGQTSLVGFWLLMLAAILVSHVVWRVHK
jgi:hypothetical protein